MQPIVNLLRSQQVATMIGVSPKKAAALMKQMPRVNIGSSANSPRWAVKEADVMAWINSRTIPAECEAVKRTRRKPKQIVRMNDLLDENGHIKRRKAK